MGVRPTTYRAGRNGFDGRTLKVLERLGYTVDTSVDPLFNERRKRGMAFAGAPTEPYHPDYADVTRPGASRILEVPITAATLPGLPKAVEALYARLPPIPYRGALKRLGLRPVWLRPSYTSLPDMLAFASRLRARGASCFNVIFLLGSALAAPTRPTRRFLRPPRAARASLPLGAPRAGSGLEAPLGRAYGPPHLPPTRRPTRCSRPPGRGTNHGCVSWPSARG
jgi:hypothetical protein